MNLDGTRNDAADGSGTMKQRLMSSSTKKRVNELRHLSDKLEKNEIPEELHSLLIESLTHTYPLYVDRASRRGVQECLRSIVHSDAYEVDLQNLTKFLDQESKKDNNAPASVFVLVEWCAAILAELGSQTSLWGEWGLKIVEPLGRLLDRCLATNLRESRKKSAIVNSRRAWRAVVKNGDIQPKALAAAIKLLTAKQASPSPGNAVLLGVLCGVCDRIAPAKKFLNENKADIYGFYNREILGSRLPLPPHVANGLADFFAGFATFDDIHKEVIPVAEKTLLRAPEVVLNDILGCFVRALPADIDLSLALEKNLLKSLLSSVKSTNITTRDGSLRTFQVITEHCQKAEQLCTVVDEIAKALKDAKSVDHRTIYCSMLVAIWPMAKVSEKIALTLSQLAAKEAAEPALGAQLKGLSKHAAFALSNGSPLDPTIQKSFAAGLSDKKPGVKRLWASAVGSLVDEIDETHRHEERVIVPLEAFLEKMASSWDEVIANPIASAQSGLVTMANVLVFLSLGAFSAAKSEKLAALFKKLNVQKQVLGSEGKPSFLFNHRVYTKLTAESDLFWAIRALDLVAPALCAPGTPATAHEAWSQAVIYFATSASSSSLVRKSTHDAIVSNYLQNPRDIGRIIINGIWSFLKHAMCDEKDTVGATSKASMPRIHLVVQAISPVASSDVQVPRDILQSQMIQLLVVCRPPFITRISWIDLCLRGSLDPSELVSTNAHSCFEQILDKTSSDEDVFGAAVFKAACDAAAELSFVAPEAVNKLLNQLIQSSLAPEMLASIGPTEAAIYRTPAGTPFIDVLASKQPRVPDKNVKDYDTLKWEEELRAQLAKKQGQQKKLSPDDQAKVNAQLAKEAKIRTEVSETAAQLRRGIGLVNSLAQGPPTDTEAWMIHAASCLYQAIQRGAGLVIGDAAALAYLSLAEKTAPRLGSLRRFVGVAALRAQEISLPENLVQEPLGDLVTRILYRLRFTAEQRQFDMTSLSYMLPLVSSVLQDNGVGRRPGDEADEQITLALDFVALHTDLFSNNVLPRRDICSLLVRSMQAYPQHYRALKDCLSGICHALAPDASSDEVHVFLRGTIAPETSVRSSCLQAIDAELELPEETFCVEIWLARHESDDDNVEIAETIWQENSLTTKPQCIKDLIAYLGEADSQLRAAAAKAFAHAVHDHIDILASSVSSLCELYSEMAKPPVPEKDMYGMPLKKDLRDPWEARHGVALALRGLAPFFDEKELVPVIQFLVDRGPLADRHANVRDAMVNAVTALIASKGDAYLEELMRLFETSLEAPGAKSEEHDLVNEAVIIMYGALARHLKSGDKRLHKVVARLLATLSTPSESVQYAIAECLPPLIRIARDQTSNYIQQVLDELLGSERYAERRGAAYGLAGIVSGTGVGALREFRIMSTLRGATEEKKDPNKRQGAFLAFELLSLVMGPLFEPYVIQIVPQLLVGFGDQTPDVRDACLDAAKTCFATMSAYGVKKVLPTLLEGLDEYQWRSKKGACDSLGAMAYLAPQQLAISLPDIIPPLTTVLNDSHKEVRGAANRSLQRFGEVISNPEIKGLVNILLKALSDPTKYTDEALDSLLKVNFQHYLDAPSLALVVRILERGLGDRSATKRKAAQIIGSLAHLTDRKDLIAHLPILVAGLRIAAVDPVPTTRATASKALGSLVEKLGEDALPDLIPSLMATLKTDTGAGDRLGSAQALSEVLAGLGISRLEDTLPSILQNVTSSKPAVREGFMSLFIFLPACFGSSFANYLGRIIPPILGGLADDVDSIRETSLRAGRLLVKNFATKAIDLLLPELQRGLADDSHRIRLSSVELVGDLLFNLTGISGKTEQDEVEENAQAAGQSLLDVLGEEKRNNVLSALYISRCDTSGLVRTAAVNVWKALVATPRTLREITPTLTQVLIRRLASSNMEQKVIASNALGELIRKSGEGILSTLLPTLEEGLNTSVDANAKQGICISLRELIAAASPEALEEQEVALISIVKSALVEPNAEVREAAAEAFDSLQRLLGKKIIDQIMPHLLGLLRREDQADEALAALLTLLTEETRSNIILPNLLPTLLHSPISAFNARAVASLASVAGSAMARRLSTVLNTLLDNIVVCQDDERLDALDGAFDAIMLSVDEHDGLNTLINTMLQLSKHDDHRKRRIADQHLATFFSKAEELDYSRYHNDLIRALLISFDDSDDGVVKAAHAALIILVSKIDKSEQEKLVTSTRQTLSQVGVPGHPLRGFCLPKGINAILPIFLQGLINGPPEQRTQAALAISEIIDKTSADALKPFVTHITGPLIRVVSDRSSEVKAAILFTLNNLLEKIPQFVKPFLPQLQRSFTKALADTSSETLRIRAAKALGTLITMTPRIDPLIGELVAGSKTPDQGVSEAMQKALYEVVSKVGSHMNEASRSSILALVDSDSGDGDESTAITNARLLGALIKVIPSEAAAGIIKSRVLTTHYSRGSVLALNAVLYESPATLTEGYPQETVATISKGIGHSEPLVAENCVLAAGKYLLTESSNKSFETVKHLFEAIMPTLQPGRAIDARRLALVVLRTASRDHNDLIRPHIPLLAPAVFANVRDMVIPIKLAAEAAFLSLFCAVDEGSAVFDKYMAGAGASLAPGPKRSMQDYFKRVASRLAAQARERREAEGGQGGLGLSNDEREDEREIWSVGKVDHGEASFE